MFIEAVLGDWFVDGLFIRTETEFEIPDVTCRQINVNWYERPSRVIGSDEPFEIDATFFILTRNWIGPVIAARPAFATIRCLNLENSNERLFISLLLDKLI